MLIVIYKFQQTDYNLVVVAVQYLALQAAFAVYFGTYRSTKCETLKYKKSLYIYKKFIDFIQIDNINLMQYLVTCKLIYKKSLYIYMIYTELKCNLQRLTYQIYNQISNYEPHKKKKNYEYVCNFSYKFLFK